MGKPLIEQVNLTVAVGTTGSTGTTSPILDMNNYEGVLFVGYMESTNTSNQLTARGGSATAALSEFMGPQSGEASGIQTNLYLDVFRPKFRYIEGHLNCSDAAGNAVLTAIRYGPRYQPATQDTATWNGKALATPNTGTATASG